MMPHVMHPTPTDTAAPISDAPKKGVVDREAVEVAFSNLCGALGLQATSSAYLDAAAARASLIAVPDGMEADRREAVRGKVKGIINAHVAECLRLKAQLHPGPTADAILAMIAAATGEAQ